MAWPVAHCPGRAWGSRTAVRRCGSLRADTQPATPCEGLKERPQTRKLTAGGSRQTRRPTEESPFFRAGRTSKTCRCVDAEVESGVVLDPFAGAGSTLVKSKDLGRRFIGIDITEEFVALAQRRAGVDVDNPEQFVDEDQSTFDYLKS